MKMLCLWQILNFKQKLSNLYYELIFLKLSKDFLIELNFYHMAIIIINC